MPMPETWSGKVTSYQLADQLVARIADALYLEAQKQAVPLRALQALHSCRHSMEQKVRQD